MTTANLNTFPDTIGGFTYQLTAVVTSPTRPIHTQARKYSAWREEVGKKPDPEM